MRRNRATVVGDEIRKILSDIIGTEIKDPRIPLLTSVVEVRMSGDLAHAECYLSVYGDEHTKQECLRAIRHARGFIRCEMCKRINLRTAPELSFTLDNTMEDAARIITLIDDTVKKKPERGDEE